MKKFKSLITEFSQEPEVIHTFEGPFTSGNFVRIGIEDVEFSSGQSLDKWEFLGKEVTIIIGESEPEVPKRELPVIPKHVADWITQYRKVFDLYPALKKLENDSVIWGRTYKWYRMNTHKFVNAYLTGEYEVEKEPLYYALIKGHEFPSGRLSLHDGCLTKMSKEEWNRRFKRRFN